MSVLSSWLLSVVATAFAVSLLEGLMPDPKVREVGKIVGGLLLLFALCEPLVQLDPGSIRFSTDAYSSALAQRTEELRQEQEAQLLLGIKEEGEAYIIAAADRLGLRVSPAVEVCLNAQGMPYFSAVKLDIPYHPQLSETIEAELGIGKAQQQWKEGT